MDDCGLTACRKVEISSANWLDSATVVRWKVAKSSTEMLGELVGGTVDARSLGVHCGFTACKEAVISSADWLDSATVAGWKIATSSAEMLGESVGGTVDVRSMRVGMVNTWSRRKDETSSLEKPSCVALAPPIEVACSWEE